MTTIKQWVAGDRIQGTRSYQEDDFSIRLLSSDDDREGEDRLLLVLADGMGGHAGGAVASATVAQGFQEGFDREAPGIADRFNVGIDAANRAVKEKQQGWFSAPRPEPNLSEMGSTLVAAYWTSVGDSILVLGRGWRDPGFSVGDDYPVACVSWNDARAFVRWLVEQTGEAFRFPSEAEWEYAARAGSASKYHFGNNESELCRYANHADSSLYTHFGMRSESCSDGVGARITAVGCYRPNSYGLYYMHGNLWEWTQDCWSDSYAGAPSDGSAWTSGDCGLRVIRGGFWNNKPANLCSANRNRNNRTDRNNNTGFRLAQSARGMEWPFSRKRPARPPGVHEPASGLGQEARANSAAGNIWLR